MRTSLACTVFLAFLYSYDQQFQESVKACETAIEGGGTECTTHTHSGHPILLLHTERHLNKQRTTTQRHRPFLKIIELSPDHPNARNYLAYMWAERGERLPEALEHIKVALEIEPDSAAFIDTLGWIYFRQGNFKEGAETHSTSSRDLTGRSDNRGPFGGCVRKTWRHGPSIGTLATSIHHER